MWQRTSCGSADIFVLDLRSHRDASAVPYSTMMGTVQKNWLKQELLSSIATWKIVISTVSAHLLIRPNSNDQWTTGFPDEADEMKQFIEQNNISNVVLVSGDLHSGGGIDTGNNIAWGKYCFFSCENKNYYFWH